jgi:hypothetical protein
LFDLAVVEVELVGPLSQCDDLVVVAEQEGGVSEAFEVLRRQPVLPVSGRERGVLRDPVVFHAGAQSGGYVGPRHVPQNTGKGRRRPTLYR